MWQQTRNSNFTLSHTQGEAARFFSFFFIVLNNKHALTLECSMNFKFQSLIFHAFFFLVNVIHSNVIACFVFTVLTTSAKNCRFEWSRKLFANSFFPADKQSLFLWMRKSWMMRDDGIWIQSVNRKENKHINSSTFQEKRWQFYLFFYFRLCRGPFSFVNGLFISRLRMNEYAE